MNPILFYEYGKSRDFLKYEGNSIPPVNYGLTRGFAILNNGTKLYLTPHNDTPKEYTLTTAYDLSTATFIRNGNISTNCGGIWMSQDGTRYYVSINSSNIIRQYTLSTPYNISTLSNPIDSPILSNSQSQNMPFITQDGLFLFINDSLNNLNKYSFGTAFNISTISLTSQVNVGNKTSYCFSSDGLKAYSILNTNVGTMFQQILSTPYDLLSVLKTNVSNQTTVLSGGNFIRPFIINDNKLFVSIYKTSTPSVNSYEFSIIS